MSACWSSRCFGAREIEEFFTKSTSRSNKLLIKLRQTQLNGRQRVGVGLISQLKIRGWAVLVVPSFSSSFQAVVGRAAVFFFV
jgi:hypothetical protein